MKYASHMFFPPFYFFVDIGCDSDVRMVTCVIGQRKEAETEGKGTAATRNGGTCGGKEEADKTKPMSATTRWMKAKTRFTAQRR